MSGTSSNGPGAIRVAPGELELNSDRTAEERGELTFTNVADRPIQIGSHIHLADVNTGLSFDRTVAHGFRLDIASVALRGRRQVPGLQIRPAPGGAA